MERTLAIIKPDAVAAQHTGEIITAIEQAGFSIIRMEKLLLSRERAEAFYDIHKERPFFGELVAFMVRSPIVVMVLERNNAVKAWRDLMGDTNPAKAAPGTIRNLYGSSIGENATHGSDAQETAAREVAFFFPTLP